MGSNPIISTKAMTERSFVAKRGLVPKMFIENRISIEINEKHENRKLSNVKLINREKDNFEIRRD